MSGGIGGANDQAAGRVRFAEGACFMSASAPLARAGTAALRMPAPALLRMVSAVQRVPLSAAFHVPSAAVLLWLLLAVVSTAQAHIASNGFLTLNVEGRKLSGSIELAMRDAELAVGLDANRDGEITWGEVRSHQRDLELYVRSKLIVGDGATRCAEEFAPVEVNERVDGNYLWLPLTATCGAAQLTNLSVDYQLMQGIDPSHRGLLTVTAWGTTQTGVLQGTQSIALNHPSVWRAFTEYLQTGVWHIWSGIDHLLFLLSLLLPAVLRRRENHWEAVPLAKPAFINILKVVTAFTVAHSVTLSLAAFDIVRLPSRLTESVIAASIVVAALNNIFPKVTEGRWRIAFTFGLLHGFGFASVLADMGLPPGARAISLVSFNLGVEAGQLAVVLAIMPLAYAIRATSFYRQAVMRWGSSAIAALAFVWLIQRSIG
jgi:HupE/UreJ protein